MVHIFDILFPPREDEITLRGISPENFLLLSMPRLAPVTRPGTVTLLSFSNPYVRAAVHEAKYHGNTYACKLLGLVLSTYIRGVAEHHLHLIMVPIPLGSARRRERGFNQTEKIVRQAVKECGGAIDTRLLKRTRETVSQVSLPFQKREENMRGAFVAIRPANPTDTYIILDDVTTTGATLQAAIDALQAGGAEHIIPIALAH